LAAGGAGMTVSAYAGASDTGRKRRRNEDSYVIAPPLFAVADGMGGAQAGEIASKLAAAALEDTDSGALAGEARVTSLIQEANRRVYERSNEDPSASGMGTTITVALVEDTGVTIGHVGDSRAYRYREGSIEQITEDHSLVNELMKSGKLSPEEAETHPQRSVITRALGTDPDVDVDSFTVETQEGDVFLLCSDGLTTMVDDHDILGVLEKHRDDLDRATKSLVSAANRGGGEDNITVIAFAISDAAETQRMPAVSEDTLENVAAPVVDTMVIPPDQVEHVLVAPGSPEAEAVTRREPISSGARVRLVLTMLALLVVAAVLLVWGLVR
jgi:serine/threonine protein phosphatase PrpC